RIRLALLSCLAAGSLFCSCTESSDQRRFYLLHNRLWEFVTGFIVAEVASQMASKESEDEGKTRLISLVSYSSTLLLVWLLTVGDLWSHDRGVQQVAACCLAAL
ncbi:hypothetical protein PFISCL1PPCAC_12184, partial [Pristionchus fissidentatus]